ncbi:hypothetical protein D039_3365, partial [Vibrio parahaemolyticus EKP-028]
MYFIKKKPNTNR